MEEPQSDSDWGDDRSLKTAESLRALRQQADQTLDDHRQRVSEIEVRLNEQLELIAAELASERLADEQTLAASAKQTALLEQLRQTLAEKEAEVEEVLEQFTAQTLEFETQLAERDEELEQVLDLSEEESQQRESLEQKLVVTRQALEDLQAQDDANSDQASDKLTKVESQLHQLDEQFRSLQEQHESLQTEHDTQQTELDEAQRSSQSAQQQNVKVVATLHEAEQRIVELSQLQQDHEQNEQQLEQTQRKFELALADVHKLKRENAELHEELLSRPAADDQESPELVSLRVERDALAERISELENAPTPAEPADGQQELEDLQRRFELAVDDVRQLKQKNSDLDQKLEAASKTTPTVTSSNDEPLDWQAQKAKLMATLDAEDQGHVDETRREEQATIEGTISITDRVVAEKDALLTEREAQIANLQTQLESRPAGQDLDELREQISAEILGDEEAVQAECAKLQQQQEQLDSKLREAELEISVQRATLARERAALEEKIAELPTEDSESEKSSTGKPRRRWLSALGIKEEDKDATD